MKQMTCSKCGNRVFFENLRCEVCGSTLGYAPDEQRMLAFEESGDDSWRRMGPEGPRIQAVRQSQGGCVQLDGAFVDLPPPLPVVPDNPHDPRAGQT